MKQTPSLEKPLFDAVSEMAVQRQVRHWKPSTLAVNRSYLRNQIIPYFRQRPIAGITQGEVQRWFADLHRTPSAANRALPVLSVIFRVAEALGLRPANSNPCTGIRRYRTRGRSRFLTGEEMRRLGHQLHVLRQQAPHPFTAIHLLLLTGCRQGEVRNLHWDDYREGHLYLRDSKTGPRTVWLCSAAQDLLANLPRTSEWIFPAVRDDGPMRTETLYRHWRLLRQAANLPAVRLHDLRHSYASFALRNGETVLTIGRLLGHRDPATTLRYLHFDDALALRAAQKVGDLVAAHR